VAERRGRLIVFAAETAFTPFEGFPSRADESEEHPMEYVRKIDFEAFDRSGADERITQKLLDHASGARTCTIHCIKTPPGGGSPAGAHVHDVDQIFYILRGTMSVEIEDERHECPPGSLVIFPAGVKHRNWNGGSVPTVHLAFNTPLPDPGVPFAKSV